jgi:hypothetical protein
MNLLVTIYRPSLALDAKPGEIIEEKVFDSHTEFSFLPSPCDRPRFAASVNHGGYRQMEVSMASRPGGGNWRQLRADGSACIPFIGLCGLITLIGLIILGCRSCSGASAVTERFLDAVAVIESQGCDTALGDAGRARGRFQFHAAAWQSVSRARERRGESVAPYTGGALNPTVSRAYAREYFQILESSLTVALGRNPTRSELYAAWNRGLARFRRDRFSIASSPLITRRACARIERICR